MKQDFKTFEDLTFSPHPNFGMGFDTQAKMFFDNGYGVSVVTGSSAYGKYEIAVLVGNSDSWKLTYDTSVTDDVIRCYSEQEVTDYLKDVQELENIKVLGTT